MNYLLDFASRKDVQNVILQAIESKSVQGVVLEVDPYWLFLWRIKEKFGESALPKYYSIWPPFRPRILPQEFGLLPGPINTDDMNWRPQRYLNYLEGLGLGESYETPIIIKVCFYPSEYKVDQPIFANSQFRIEFETRPVARFSFSKKKYRPLIGGVSGGTGQTLFGIIGGILTDGNVDYGVSCAHFLDLHDNVDQPAYYDNSNHDVVGSVTIRKDLVEADSSTTCNPWSPNQGKMNEIDLALVKIDRNINSKLEILNIGKLHSYSNIGSLSQGQTVEFNGRSSSHKILEIGGLGVACKLKDYSGKDYCFKNLIELKDSSYLNNVFTPPIKDGDSGAWVCLPSSGGYDWCGSVIGCDRFTGFMVSSDFMMDWLNNDQNLGLTVK